MSLASVISSGMKVAAVVAIGVGMAGCAPQKPSDSFLVAAPAPVWPAISATNFDGPMFSERVTAHLNTLRSEHGLKPLAANPALDAAAAIQARNMRALRSFSATVDGAPRGERHLEGRLAQVGAIADVAVQNIAVARMHDVLSRPVRMDSQTCATTLVDTGAPAPMHTYDSLAAAVVEQWSRNMNGRNPILSPDLARTGVAAAIDARSFICGDVFVAQVMTDASLRVAPHPRVPDAAGNGLLRSPF